MQSITPTFPVMSTTTSTISTPVVLPICSVGYTSNQSVNTLCSCPMNKTWKKVGNTPNYTCS